MTDGPAVMVLKKLACEEKVSEIPEFQRPFRIIYALEVPGAAFHFNDFAVLLENAPEIVSYKMLLEHGQYTSIYSGAGNTAAISYLSYAASGTRCVQPGSEVIIAA